MPGGREGKPAAGKGVVVNHEEQYSRKDPTRTDPKAGTATPKEQTPTRDIRPDSAGKTPDRRR